MGDEPGTRQREGGAQQLPQLRVCVVFSKEVADRVIGRGDQRQSQQHPSLGPRESRNRAEMSQRLLRRDKTINRVAPAGTKLAGSSSKSEDPGRGWEGWLGGCNWSSSRVYTQRQRRAAASKVIVVSGSTDQPSH